MNMLTGQPEASEPAKATGFFLPKILVCRHIWNGIPIVFTLFQYVEQA
jgi:hypothetical protein